MALCSGPACFVSVPRRGMLCRACKLAARLPVCSVAGCPRGPGAGRGLCGPHHREATAAGTLPPKGAQGSAWRAESARVVYRDPDREGHEGPSERDRRRVKTRRRIEALEEALRIRREDVFAAEADW